MTIRPALPAHGSILTLGEHRVRVRHNLAQIGSPTPILWDILDGDRVIATQISRPSRDDCALAVSRARGQAEPVSIPKPGQFIPGALPTREKRTEQRRARQMAEEADEE